MFKEAEQDRELFPKLIAEAPGILAWAVRGCLEWQAQGLGMPPKVTDSTEHYREENDPIAQFIEDRCIVHPQAQVRAADLWESYVDWARRNAVTGLPLQAKSTGLT